MHCRQPLSRASFNADSTQRWAWGKTTTSTQLKPQLHAKSEQWFCLSRCTWTPRKFAKRDITAHMVRLRARWLVHSLPSVQIRHVELASGKNPTSRQDGSPWIPSDDPSIERHRHDVQGRRHGYPKGLGSVCSEVDCSDVVFQAPSKLRVQLDTEGHRRQPDRWLGGSDNERSHLLLRVVRGLDR